MTPASQRKRPRLLHVVGARPNFMKAEPVLSALDRTGRFSQILVHTGQHYDAQMSAVFIEQLQLRRPDYELGVGSGSHAAQTADLLRALEPVFLRERPTLVVVYGDVNSTLAAALVAAKLAIAVAHVEAGLRSGDRSMPEELNRILCDHLADVLFTTSRTASETLSREGIPGERIAFVGNTMIDTVIASQALAAGRSPSARDGLPDRGYALVTLHRPSNVDDPSSLAALVDTLVAVSGLVPAVFPVHPRTLARLRESEHLKRLEAIPGMHLCEPLGYLDFLALLSAARVVVTDSGGIQAEAAVLGVPCLTLRTTTEWTETLQPGVNRLVAPHDGPAILSALDETLRDSECTPVQPEYWDGHAAERIALILSERYGAA